MDTTNLRMPIILGMGILANWRMEMREDLIALIEQRRIALLPEYEGCWRAQVYDEEDEPLGTGFGTNIQEAIKIAINNAEVQLIANAK